MDALTKQLEIEVKIKEGAVNLLQVFAEADSASSSSAGPAAATASTDKHVLRRQVEGELAAANQKIDALERKIEAASSRQSELTCTSCALPKSDCAVDGLENSARSNSFLRPAYADSRGSSAANSYLSTPRPTSDRSTSDTSLQEDGERLKLIYIDSLQV